MPLVVTEAIVLHAFDYLESSRILRLITPELGVVSVLAKGARRTRGRVGTGVDLFAQGDVQLYTKAGRDLHTLAAFDVTVSRTTIAADLSRFMAASAVAELVLRFGRDDPNLPVFEAIRDGFDMLALAPPEEVASAALGTVWRLLAASGFAPTLTTCASCHVALEPDARAVFSPPAGGALCDRCARFAPVGRAIPADARATIQRWLTHDRSAPYQIILTEREARAHQRLAREFLREHLPDDRPLQAYESWEQSLSLV